MTVPAAQPQTRETLMETVREALAKLHPHATPLDANCCRAHDQALAALSVLAARLDAAETQRDDAVALMDAKGFPTAVGRKLREFQARAVSAERERDEARLERDYARIDRDWFANQAEDLAEMEDGAAEGLFRRCQAAEARLKAATDALREADDMLATISLQDYPTQQEWRRLRQVIDGFLAARAVLAGEDGQA